MELDRKGSSSIRRKKSRDKVKKEKRKAGKEGRYGNEWKEMVKEEREAGKK